MCIRDRFVGNPASQAAQLLADAGNNVQHMRVVCRCAVTPDDTVRTLKVRLARSLRLNYPTIDEPRQMGPTLRLAYTLQQRLNASKLFDQRALGHGGILTPDMDNLTMEQLGIRNSDECTLSLTCDDTF
eukprot:TRINITY_DN2627_c0_g1_i4.p1 TRINITY_DN2627_c0_g1~~TRINITY_DN2627_c0_g1_i4.p1  ORF type:complete len:129 (+),score=15.07 TRINITY_DN2627_c0_g1_i4:75-461(+)